MKNATEKELKHESYWVDYPYENMCARFDGKEGKFYFKLYGKKEIDVDPDNATQFDFASDAIRFGDEILEEEYNKK